jgi:hypothetical protein
LNKYLNHIAQGISYLFHPLFIPIYALLIVQNFFPKVFTNISSVNQGTLAVNMVLNLIVFPALTVFLMKQLKFIDSYHVPDRKQRIFTIFAYTFFAFWTWAFVLNKNPINYPKEMVRYGLSVFIISSMALVCNAFYKISLHSIGAASLLGFTIALCIKLGFNLPLLIVVILLSASIVWSRYYQKSHNTFELYSGFMLGLIGTILFQLLF